jgi:PAS domain S-box-containing protein
MKNPRVADVSHTSGLIGAQKVFRHVGLTFVGFLLCMPAGQAAAAKPNAKNVLVLSGGRHESVSIPIMESSLRSHVPGPVNFSIADLETPPFADESDLDGLAEAFRRTFSNKKIDLIVAVMDPSLRFAVRYRDKIFPGIPVSFMSITSPQAGQRMWRWPGVTGVVSAVGIGETIDLALRLHPDTTQVAIITNESETERDYLAAVHAELLRRKDKVKEIDLIGPPSGWMIERVAALPPHTIALFQLWPHDADQPALGVNDVLAEVSHHMPTYCIFPGLCMDHGGIGGVYNDPTKDAVMAGEIAARVLKGTRPDDIPIAYNSDLHVTVDWRQLRRWHIPESALPPGSMILSREPTLWESYRKSILAAIAVVVIQALLIIGLLWERARKKKAEAVLNESEKRFRLMADTMPALIWMCNARGKVTYLNDRRIAFTGRDPHAGYRDTWTTHIHPDDRKKVEKANARALKNRQPFSKEYRLRRSDGVYRWIYDVASPRVNGDGSFAGFVGAAIDTTDQKLAREALEKVSGQLIEAQEQERSRIARELHDDICQRLAVLSMEIDQANLEVDGPRSDTKKKLDEIGELCSEIGHDVQSLSHQLHSSILDCLGIASAIRGFCDELSKQYDVSIEFTEQNVRKQLPKDISLCLFRIAQEAVHNAVKYSGVSEFTVELSESADTIQLLVMDQGAGFDVEEAKKEGGLGLVSMQERAHLVHGTISIESKPGEGTKVIAVVPLAGMNLVPMANERDHEMVGVTEVA